jgi:hypothetical protein
MARGLASNEADLPNEAWGAESGAALIRVPASAQQAPGALLHCPVCAQPYTSESLPMLSRRAPGAPDIAHRSETRGEQVLCCAHCGTYGVGLLDVQSEAGGALERGEP